MKPKSRTTRRVRRGVGSPFPPLTRTGGVWSEVRAGESAAMSGGGRRSVLTEALPVPGGHGWLVRTIVSASSGSEAMALCFVPKR